MAAKRSLTLFWCLAFVTIIMGGIALLWLSAAPQSLPRMQQKIVQVQYDVDFQLGKRLRAQGETSCFGLLGTWLVAMGGLGIALPLLFSLILCRAHLNRSLSVYPDSKTGHWGIIFKSIRQIYWRLNISRFEKLAAHLILLGILLFAVQIWWLPFCFQPLNLSGIFLLCYLCGCYIYLLTFYRQFYSLQESVRVLETRLDLKQRLTTCLELIPARVNPFQTVLIAQTAQKLEGQKISWLLPHTWPFIPRRAFFYQLASITLVALILDWAGPSLVASYYVPRISEQYTRKSSTQTNALDKLLVVQSQELNRLSRELYLKQDSLDPQMLANKLAALANDLGHLAVQDKAGSGLQASGYSPHPNPPPQGRRGYSPSPLWGEGWGEGDAVRLESGLSRLAKQFLSPVVINASQPGKTPASVRKEWLSQAARKLKNWQEELKDMLNQADSEQAAAVVISTASPSPSPLPSGEREIVSPEISTAAQMKEVAKKMEGLKITSDRNLPVVSALKSNLWQQAEQLKEMADKIEKAGKERKEEVDFSQQYKEIAKEISRELNEMSREVKNWDGLRDAFHIQANAGGQFRQLGSQPDMALPVKLERGGASSNPLADARVIMGQKGSSDPDAAPKFRVKGESDPHYHPKVTDLTMDEADTSSQSDIGERAAIITHGKDQGSSPNHGEEQGQERKQGQVLSGEKSASHPGASPSSAKVSGNPQTASPDAERLSQVASLTQAAQDSLKALKANLGAGTPPGGNKPTGVEELKQAAADMESLAEQVQWADDSGNAGADALKNQAGRELKRLAGQLNVLAQKQIRQQNRDQNSRDSDKQFLQEKLTEGEKKLADLSSQLNNAAMKQQVGWVAPSATQQNKNVGLDKAQPNLQQDQANLNSIADELNRLAKSIADIKSAKQITQQNQNVGLDKTQPNLQQRKAHQEKGEKFDKDRLQAAADGMDDISQKIDKLEKELKHPERQDNGQYESQQLLIAQKMEQLGQELRSQLDSQPQVQSQSKRLGAEMENFAQGTSTWGLQTSDGENPSGQKAESDPVDAEFTAAWLNLPGGRPAENSQQQKQNEQKISSQFASAKVKYSEKQFSAMDKIQKFLQDIKQLEQKVAGQRNQTKPDRSRKELSLGAASKLQQIQQGQGISPDAQGKSSPYPQEERLDSQDTFERIAARVQVMYREIAAAGMEDMPKGYQIPRSELSQFRQPEGLGDVRPLTKQEKEQYISRPVDKHLPDPLPHNVPVSYKPESALESFTEINFTVKGNAPYPVSRPISDTHALGLHQAPTIDRAVQQQTVPLAYRKIIQSLYRR